MQRLLFEQQKVLMSKGLINAEGAVLNVKAAGRELTPEEAAALEGRWKIAVLPVGWDPLIAYLLARTILVVLQSGARVVVGRGISPVARLHPRRTTLAGIRALWKVGVLSASQPFCNFNLFVLDNYQMTPYHLACENGHAGCVGHLLSMLDQQPQETQRHRRASQMRRGSALFLAEKAGHADVVEIINSARSYGEDDGGQTSECSSSGSSSSSRSRLDGGDADDQARADPAIGQPGAATSAGSQGAVQV